MRAMNITRRAKDLKTRGMESQMGTGRWNIEQKDELIVQDVISISNHDFCAKRDKCTKEIREELDPRDKEYNFPFQATFNITQYLIQRGITKSQNKTNQQKNKKDMVEKNSEEYLKMRRAVFNYVSEACQNVSSISFRLLSKGELTDGQAKAFAVRIILANIQSVLTEINSKLQQYAEKEGKPELGRQFDDLMERLTKAIDEELSEIFSQLAGHYPQAPPGGATANMREVITDVNRVQDEQNNLIFSSDIKISKYVQYTQYEYSKYIYSKPELYTGFVMEVINQAIGITRTIVDKDLTLFQKFQQFNQTLFAFANTDKKSQKLTSDDKNRLEKLTSAQRVKIFHNILQANRIKKQPQTQQQKQQQKQHQTSLQFQQRIVQQYKKHHKILSAQKIPNHVKQFSYADIKEGNFRVDNSSVLRIMTKWAQSLQEIFERPEQEITERIYQVKDFSNSLSGLDYQIDGNDLRSMLYWNIRKQYVEVKKQLNKLKEENTLFQSYILSEKEQQCSYLKRFSKVREASAQMNAIAIEYTKKYLCILIHHLVKAGFVQLVQNSDYTMQDIEQVNLVAFRVGDLMRSKLQCDERSFINLMKIFQQLDSSKEMEGKFKLVRIKNKLGMRDNNVLINYMFMGKVQCELQLSVQKMDERDKHYYEFCHFLYQLTRGKFGVLTECATVACQHDSMINSSTDAYYRPKCYETLYIQKKKHKIHEKDKDIYKCISCGQLKMGENKLLFQQESYCNQCIVKQEGALQKMRNKNEFLLKQKRIRKYGQINHGNYIVSAKNQNADKVLKLYRAWKPQEQKKLFLVEINDYVLGSFQQKGFQYDKIDYFNILNKKKKNEDLKELTYNLGDKITDQALQSIGINASRPQRIQRFFQANRNYRMEKNIIKQIQLKSELVVIKNNQFKWKILKSIVSAYLLGNIEGLRYRKYKKLDWSHIKVIDLQQNKIQDTKQVFQFVRITRNCNNLDIGRNQISQINFGELDINPIKDISLNTNTNEQEIQALDDQLLRINVKSSPSLVQLYLNNNTLRKIDLSSCINLQKLDLSSNYFQQIDLTLNINLKQLKLSENKLREVDLSQNTKLLLIYIGKNQLQNIDLQSKPYLKQIDIQRNLKMQTVKFWSSELKNHKFEQLSPQCQLTVLYRKQKSQKHDKKLADLKAKYTSYTFQSGQRE